MLLLQNDSERVLNASSDEDDIENAQNVALNVRKMVSLLPSVFQPDQKDAAESTALVHDDLSQRNILVDTDGNLTAIVDWECVSALPLWKVCQVPAFLDGRERRDKPVWDRYATDENGNVSDLYREHFLEYEQTELWKDSLDEMKCIEPAWFTMYSSCSNRRKADCEVAIHLSSDIFYFKRIGKWLDNQAHVSAVSNLDKELDMG